jgi:hypothetical protein
VIETKEFYKPFSTIKMKLQQSTSHHTAGEFLHTLKTMMAKLKVCTPTFRSGWITDQPYLLNRQMIGELFRVRPLVLTFVLALNTGCRNYGRASVQFSSRNLA